MIKAFSRKAYRPKFDADLHRARAAAFQQPSPGLQHELAIPCFLEEEMGDAAGCIATGRNLAAVDVEDTHPGRSAASGRFLGRRLNGEQLVAADADLSIADSDDVVPSEGTAIGAPIEDDEMVAQAVHLHERPLGRSCCVG